MISYKTGSMFNSRCQTVVNPTNCVGAMGKGIALEFRMLLPKMYEKYKDFCKAGLIVPGKLWIYSDSNIWEKVLNFPTKSHRKYPSRLEYIEEGLKKLTETYQERGIKSIAFPLLGCQNGGLAKGDVLSIMKKYLDDLNIDIEIWDYQENSYDQMWELVSKFWSSKIPETTEEMIIKRAVEFSKNFESLYHCGYLNKYHVKSIGNIMGTEK